MNIIEAFQQAENGKLITNVFLKSKNCFLKYSGAGVFSEYEIIDGEHHYKFEVREFTIAYIISISWEIVNDNYFNKRTRAGYTSLKN